MFSCRCPMAFSPSSHRRRPTGKFAKPPGPFLLHPAGPHRKPYCDHGETDPWGSIINPIWAAHLVDVEEAWDRAPEPGPDLTSGKTPHWGFASFALQPSRERCSQASLGETDKWIETRSVLEGTTIERFLLEGEDTQAPHEKSVKGPNTLANMASPLPSSLDLIPVPRDERLSGPERDQLLQPPARHRRSPRGRSAGAPA